jgi:hypothetical protein
MRAQSAGAWPAANVCQAEDGFCVPAAFLTAGCARVQRVQLFARLEADSLAGSDAYFSAGAGIAADAGFAGADAENAKSAQFDALTGGKGLLQAFENRIHRRFCLAAWQAGALDYMMDDVLLNQWGTSLAQLNSMHNALRW